MSIWSTDLGYDGTWPEWFLEYRRADDAEMREKIAAVQRGEMTDANYAAWALENAGDAKRWRESLRPEQRAWLEEQEEADLTHFVPREVMERVLSRIDMGRVWAAPDPLREYFRQLNTVPEGEEDPVREYLRARRAEGKSG